MTLPIKTSPKSTVNIPLLFVFHLSFPAAFRRTFKMLLLLSLLLPTSLAFCPDGCACDEDLLHVTCLKSKLEVIIFDVDNDDDGGDDNDGDEDDDEDGSGHLSREQAGGEDL